MCCKRRAAACRGQRDPAALEAGGPAFGPPFARRGCGGPGQRGPPKFIQKLVSKAIEKRNAKMEARQQSESAGQVPQQSVTRVDEKHEPAVHSKAQPLKIIFDDGHEEYLSEYANEKESEAEAGQKPGEGPPRYSTVVKS